LGLIFPRSFEFSLFSGSLCVAHSPEKFIQPNAHGALNSYVIEEFDDLLSPWAEVARSERTL